MDEWDRMLRQWDAVMMAEMWRDLAESTERLFAKGVPGPWVGPVTFPPVPVPEPDADEPHIVGGS